MTNDVWAWHVIYENEATCFERRKIENGRQKAKELLASWERKFVQSPKLLTIIRGYSPLINYSWMSGAQLQ